MSTTTSLSATLEAILMTPGMDDKVKINLQLSRKEAFLLAQVVECGLSPKDAEVSANILKAMNGEATEALKSIPETLLEKTGLTKMNEKLKALK